MKKALVIFSLVLLIAACNNGNADKNKQDTTPALSQTNNELETMVDTLGFHTDSATNRFAKGSELIAKSDCITCHKVKEKLVGPAYTQIAEKYPLNQQSIDYLAGKIITGGKGVWGEVPMNPHAGISQGDAAEMARYILSLKGIK